MFSRFVTLLPIAALVAVATAAPNALDARNGGQCDSGANYCCDQTFSTPFTALGSIGGVLNPIIGASVPVGLSCDPITVIGVGSGAKCTTQCASCDSNTINGVVNIVCSPISANAA